MNSYHTYIHITILKMVMLPFFFEQIQEMEDRQNLTEFNRIEIRILDDQQKYYMRLLIVLIIIGAIIVDQTIGLPAIIIKDDGTSLFITEILLFTMSLIPIIILSNVATTLIMLVIYFWIDILTNELVFSVNFL